jgi:hypothetical protein
MKQHWSRYLLVVAITIGLFTRLSGIKWDQGFLLHPDERFLTMVTGSIKFPEKLIDFFITSKSTLNPHNVGNNFYVYGTFPVFLIKTISTIFSLSTLVDMALLGRTISGLSDVFIILIIYKTSLSIYKNKTVAGLGSLFYSILPLPTQLGHFYTVDTFLSLFIIITFLQLIRVMSDNSKPVASILMGISYGLAISSKYSAFLFFPIIFLGYFIKCYKLKAYKSILINILLFMFFLFITIHLFQPYLFDGLFSINPRILSDLKTLKSFENTTGWFPPAVQWINQKKLLFPVINLFWIGLSPAPFLIALISTFLAIKKSKLIIELVPILVWIAFIFTYNSFGFAMTGRYFYPALPFVAILSGYLLHEFQNKYFLPSILVLVVCLLPEIAFMSIYGSEHTRIQATRWILSNVPPGSSLSCEEWDDCLPLVESGSYRIVPLSMYSADSNLKLKSINATLKEVDYLILSSNRVFASITSAPELYPQTSNFYNQLFGGTTDFSLIRKFVSRPNISLPLVRFCFVPWGLGYGNIAKNLSTCDQPGISLVDDYSEEAYTVYDHPQVFVFKRNNSVF